MPPVSVSQTLPLNAFRMARVRLAGEAVGVGVVVQADDLRARLGVAQERLQVADRRLDVLLVEQVDADDRVLRAAEDLARGHVVLRDPLGRLVGRLALVAAVTDREDLAVDLVPGRDLLDRGIGLLELLELLGVRRDRRELLGLGARVGVLEGDEDLLVGAARGLDPRVEVGASWPGCPSRHRARCSAPRCILSGAYSGLVNVPGCWSLMPTVAAWAPAGTARAAVSAAMMRGVRRIFFPWSLSISVKGSQQASRARVAARRDEARCSRLTDG